MMSLLRISSVSLLNKNNKKSIRKAIISLAVTLALAHLQPNLWTLEGRQEAYSEVQAALEVGSVEAAYSAIKTKKLIKKMSKVIHKTNL